VDANIAPDKDTKRPSPALVDTEAVFGFDATMGTDMTVDDLFSPLDSSRVVLDSFFV
jgi:hypothetical protein